MSVVMTHCGHLHVALTFIQLNFLGLPEKITLSGCTLRGKKQETPLAT
jgi:hypothetical protein